MPFEAPTLDPAETAAEPETEEHREIREAVESMHEPIRDLIEQSWEKIQAGSYDLIVGDDISGRLPTLVMSKFINRVNEAQGHDRVPTKFFTGSTHIRNKIEFDMKKGLIGGMLRIGELDMDKTKEALVVTDAISSGSSIEPIAKALKAEGIEVDVSTISIDNLNPEAAHRDLEEKLDIKINSAGTGNPEIHGGGDTDKKMRIREYTGLTKKGVGPMDVWSTKSPDYDAEKVALARELADNLADQLFEEFRDRLE